MALVERFKVHVAPFVQSPMEIKIGPGGKGIPIAEVSDQAGDYVQFSGDAKTLYWSLGPDLYHCPIEAAMEKLIHSARKEESASEASEHPSNEDSESSIVTKQPIGFSTAHAKPDGIRVLVGAKILTMGATGVIEDGVVVIQGNRIQSVGRREAVAIPKEAELIDVSGQVLMPGLIDTHAHGAQATSGITPQYNWVDYARLAFGVTTIPRSQQRHTQHLCGQRDDQGGGDSCAADVFHRHHFVWCDGSVSRVHR